MQHKPIFALHAFEYTASLVQKPRTVKYTETIEKAVPVEREVMVQKAFTEHVPVDAERPVERMKKARFCIIVVFYFACLYILP